jgi:hypothetical protein
MVLALPSDYGLYCMKHVKALLDIKLLHLMNLDTS